MLLEEGQKIKLKDVDGNESTATLVKIDKSRSGYFPDDYMFQFDEGEVELIKNEHTYPLFPLPERMVEVMLEKGVMIKL